MSLATRCPKCGNTMLCLNEDGDLECGCGKIIYTKMPDSAMLKKKEGKRHPYIIKRSEPKRYKRLIHYKPVIEKSPEIKEVERLRNQERAKLYEVNQGLAITKPQMRWDEAVINEFKKLRSGSPMLSYNQIRAELKRRFGKTPSPSTLSDWDYRFEVNHHDFLDHSRRPDIMIEDLAEEHNGFVGTAEQIKELLTYASSTKLEDTQALKLGYITKVGKNWEITVRRR